MATILIIDDNGKSREYMEALLGRHGHHTQDARDVTAALAMCRAAKPDLIITDVLMPGSNGFEFVRQLRGDKGLADIPVIFYTAAYHEDGRALRFALACGVSRSISKLATARSILEAIDSVLEASDSSEMSTLPLDFDREHARVLNDHLFAKVRELEESNANLVDSEQRLQGLAKSLRSVLEDERAKIARHLHDELGQALTMLKMSCIWIGTRLPAAPEGVTERLKSAVQLADETIHRVRRLATELRPAILDLGTAAAVEWLAQEFRHSSGIECIVDADEEDDLADSRAATEMFRIFQETLTNVVRHSAATKVNVKLKRKGVELVLEVRDNGVGITDSQIADRTSLGILGMRERVALTGGAFSIQGHPSRGTVVRVRMPIRLVA